MIAKSINDKKLFLHAKNSILVHLTILFLLLSIWYLPFIGSLLHQLDLKIFLNFNKSLTFSKTWEYFWGYLNHPNESWLNLVGMLGINILAIVRSDSNVRKRNIILSLYFWFFFQFVLLITHFIFSDILYIRRSSPSLFTSPYIMLSKSLGIADIKDNSQNCFPAGHALVAIYWLSFMFMLKVKSVNKLVVLGAILMCLPRMFSGAHWASDIIFTAIYARLWFFISCVSAYFGLKAVKKI